MRRSTHSTKAGVRGFTLVELMVGLVIGILVLTAATAAFLNVSSSRREMEKTNRQVENGRYAMQLLADDIGLAGYWSEFDPTVVSAPAVIPSNPCTVDPVELKLNVRVHIQTYAAGAVAPTCVTDVKAGTPIIVVRRAASCPAGTGTLDCAATAAGTTYMQAALCNAELALPTIAQRYAVSATLADFTLHKRDCATVADIRKYIVHIYFVANNNNAGDGIPTLKRAQLGAGAFAVQPLVEGIDDMQLEYMLDTSGDSVPDVVATDPATYSGCATSACVANLLNIVGVKIHVLARNTESTPGHVDTKVYPMGPVTDGPYNDSYKRHAYGTLVRVANAAGRRE